MTIKSWDQMDTMEKHRMINDEPLRAEQLRALSKSSTAGLTAAEREVAQLAEKQLEDMGTMGLHRLLNDQPRAALALFESAAKANPEKHASRIASLRDRLGIVA